MIGVAPPAARGRRQGPWRLRGCANLSAVTRFETPLRTLLVLLAALALSLAPTWCETAAIAPVFVPTPADPPSAGQLRLEGQTWISAADEYTLRVQMIDDDQRRRYIEHVTGLATDPFAAPPDEPPRFLTFVVEIENHGAASLSFNPTSCWLTGSRATDVFSPYDMDQLGFDYRSEGLELPPAYAKAAGALLEHPRLVEPGQSVAGLLVYRALPPRTRKMQLDLQLSLANGDVVRVSAPYRRLKEKDKPAS